MRAYTLLVDRSSLECPARVSVHLLKKLDPTADVVVIMPPRLTLHIPKATLKPSGFANYKGSHGYRNTFMKLRAFELMQYETVIMLDIDLIPWMSPLLLFDTIVPTHTVAAPRAYWLRQPFLSSGGPVVFHPSRALLRRAHEALNGTRSRTYPGEMDWFNHEFRDDAVYLTGFQSLLNGEFVPGDRIFGYWGQKLNLNASSTLSRATFVHCIAGWKPWIYHEPAQTRELRRLYLRWEDAKREVCEN